MRGVHDGWYHNVHDSLKDCVSVTYVGYFILCAMSIVYDGLGDIDICDAHDGLKDSNVLNVYVVHD